jgi:uncharacterized protein with ParB-like and HNH nuclease domain
MSFQAIQEPRVSYLEQIMSDIHAGLIKVPRFQRREVWPWEAQRDLLCSVFEGLPIGAILLWQTRLPNIKYRPTIGPFKLPNQDLSPSHSYVLDGLQRLTTIYSMVYHPIEDISGAPSPSLTNYTVYCDLEADDVANLFILESQLERLNIDPTSKQYFPLKLVFKAKEIMRFQRSIIEENEEWIEKIEEIVTAFKNYKLPIVPLASDDQQLATKSFERVNTRGESMSETHMLNALSYTEKFELLERLEVNTEKFLGEDPNWSEGLDDEFILMAMKLSVGKGPYYKQTDELAKLIDQKQVENVFRSLKAMINFSQNVLHISFPNSFPYKLQMLGLTYAFMKRPLIDKDELVAWFHLTSYFGLFGLTGRISENALKDFMSFVDNGHFEWSQFLPTKLLPVPSEVNYRASRAKALLFAMAEHMKGYGGEDFHKFIATRKGRSLILATNFEGLGLDKRPGYLFMTKAKNISIEDIQPNDYEKHFINAQLIELLNNGELKLFADKREQLIFDFEVETFVKPSLRKLKIEINIV